MSEKINPSSKEGERAILCSILENSKLFDDISAYLHKDYFHFKENARMFEILNNMFALVRQTQSVCQLGFV